MECIDRSKSSSNIGFEDLFLKRNHLRNAQSKKRSTSKNFPQTIEVDQPIDVTVYTTFVNINPSSSAMLDRYLQRSTRVELLLNEKKQDFRLNYGLDWGKLSLSYWYAVPCTHKWSVFSFF